MLYRSLQRQTPLRKRVILQDGVDPFKVGSYESLTVDGGLYAPSFEKQAAVWPWKTTAVDGVNINMYVSHLNSQYQCECV